MKKIFIIVNSPLFIIQHLTPIINKLKDNYIVYLLYEEDKNYKIDFIGVKSIPIPIKRNPSVKDLFALLLLVFIRILISPHISISFTPKAGLLNAITSFCRGKTYHYFTGQRWVKFKKLKLFFYKYIDRFIAKTCDKVFCDSFSQADFLAAELNINKPKVIAKGSVSGVSFEKYNVEKHLAIEKLKTTKNFISKEIKRLLVNKEIDNNFVFGFVGRLTIDKGINELIEAFKLHNEKFNNSFLLLIGPNELNKETYKNISSLKNCYHIEFIKEIQIIMPCLSCLVLPSYREGFGSVILEAAASKIPIISTDIPGPRDFINHLENGYLVKPKDVYTLKNALDYFKKNEKNTTIFAINAFKKCEKYYSEKYVSNSFIKELNKE